MSKFTLIDIKKTKLIKYSVSDYFCRILKAGRMLWYYS